MSDLSRSKLSVLTVSVSGFQTDRFAVTVFTVCRLAVFRFGVKFGQFCHFAVLTVLPFYRFPFPFQPFHFDTPPCRISTPPPLSNKYKSCRSLRFFEIRDFLNLIALRDSTRNSKNFKG